MKKIKEIGCLPELHGEEWPVEYSYMEDSEEEISFEEDNTEESSREFSNDKCIIAAVQSQRSDKNRTQNKITSSSKISSPEEQKDLNIEINQKKILEEQKKDRDLSIVIEWKNAMNKRPDWKDVRIKSQMVKTLWQQWDKLMLQDGVLMRFQDVEWRKEPLKQWIIPLNMRKEVLREIHNQKFCGHLGITKSLHRLKQKMYWPGMVQDVTNWCVGCYKCMARKPKTGPKCYPLGQAPVGDRLERVALDILEPGVVSEAGNRYILVIGDYFTKWMEAYAITDHTAYTVADTFVTQFVCRYGVPQKIHTDQGREFESELFT